MQLLIVIPDVFRVYADFFFKSDRYDRINVFLCLFSLTLGCRVSYQHQHLSVINFDTCLTEWWLHMLSAFASVFDMKNLHHKAWCMTIMATKCSLCWLNHSLWHFVSVDKLQTTGPAHAWADTFSFFSCRLMAMVTEYQRDTLAFALLTKTLLQWYLTAVLYVNVGFAFRITEKQKLMLSCLTHYTDCQVALERLKDFCCVVT